MAVTIVAVVVVAVVAGVVLARASGFRSARDLSTGDIRTTNRELLLEAGALGADGRFAEAIEIYDDVLESAPSNAEALAYKGWYLYRSGDLDDALPALDDAVAADATFPDARVFRAIVFNDLGRYDEAATELDAFAQSDPPPSMVELVEGNRLPERVLAGRLTEAIVADAEPLEVVDATPDEIAQAARFTEPEVAVRVYTAVIDADPDNVIALTYRGQLFTLTGDPDVVAGGLADLDRAVQVDPDYPDARLWRAAARLAIGDVAAAADDLTVFESLDVSEELAAIARDAGLRDRIAELEGS